MPFCHFIYSQGDHILDTRYFWSFKPSEGIAEVNKIQRRAPRMIKAFIFFAIGRKKQMRPPHLRKAVFGRWYHRMLTNFSDFLQPEKLWISAHLCQISFPFLLNPDFRGAESDVKLSPSHLNPAQSRDLILPRIWFKYSFF